MSGALYLAVEATAEPAGAGAPWRRFRPVARPDVSTLHRAWLADHPARPQSLEAKPVIVDLAETPGTQDGPAVRITPWSVAALREAAPSLRLEYRVDVLAGDPAQHVRFLDAIVGAILSDSRLTAMNLGLALAPFAPSSEPAPTPEAVPLVFRITTDAEVGPRRSLPLPIPFVVSPEATASTAPDRGRAGRRA
jgi:hypothetical protein